MNMIIIFEGIAGSGKSTLIKNFINKTSNICEDCCEIYPTFVKFKYRRKNKNFIITDTPQFLLRSTTSIETIITLLKHIDCANTNIIFDRLLDSEFVYSNVSRKNKLSTKKYLSLLNLLNSNKNIHTIYVRCHPFEAITRCEMRKNHRNADERLIHSTYNAYEFLYEHYHHKNFLEVDTTFKTIEESIDEVIKYVKKSK